MISHLISPRLDVNGHEFTLIVGPEPREDFLLVQCITAPGRLV